MAAYQSRQSFFSRLHVLRLRLHHCFQLVQQQQQPSPAARAALDSCAAVFRSFAPFGPPFPQSLFHHLVSLYCTCSPPTALTLLAALPFHYDSHVRLLRALAGQQEEAAVSELLRRMRAEQGEQLLNAETAGLWLQSAAADVSRLEAVWSELRRCASLRLSSGCYAQYIAPMASAGRTAEVRQALSDMEADGVPLSPEVAAAVCRLALAAPFSSSFSPSSASASASGFFPPFSYLPELASHGIAVTDSFLLCLLQQLLHCPSPSSPEHAHLLLLWSPSLRLSSFAFSLVLRCYAHREHRGSGRIGLRDVLVIERLLSEMEAAALQQDDGVRQVRLMLAAQRGDGDEVLRLMRDCLQVVAAAACPPSSSLFLPVLRSIAALSHPHRLVVLRSLHGFLHSQQLSSMFSFSLLLQLQSELGDAAGMRRTLGEMRAAAGIPLTVAHWEQLLACSSSSLSQVRLLRRMMTGLHLLPSPLTDALVIAKHGEAADVLGAELAFSAFLRSACPSPPLLLRIAMIDLYLQAGKVRHACRHAWKIVSGEREKDSSSRSSSGSPAEGNAELRMQDELTEEEVLRLLQAMRQQSLGSRREVESLLAAVEEDSRLRAARAEETQRRWRDELALRLQLGEDEQLLEHDRRSHEREQRRLSSLLQLRRREDETGEQAARVSRPLAQRVCSLLRRLQQPVPFVNMDAVLNARKTEREERREPQPALSAAPLTADDRADEQQLSASGDGSFLLSLDEDAHEPQPDALGAAAAAPAAVSATPTASAFSAPLEQQGGRGSLLSLTAEEAVSSALFEAANRLVASRMPNSGSGSRAEQPPPV